MTGDSQPNLSAFVMPGTVASHPVGTVARVETLVEPGRPTADQVAIELAEHVRALAGPDAVPRPDQIAAVTAMVADRRRTLLVARTGFGKSAVYFSATRMLRDRGWGPTVVVSPLLALMRDQVAAAERLGLRAVTINSSNIDSWAETEAQIAAGSVDLLLIAPERLANAGFRRRVFDTMQTRAFALVCDEAHCISDWGHDFRPDYRRLRRLLADLPPWTPVLATTATANQRVTDDVAQQLGEDTLVLRTSLDRESLRLSVVDLPDDAHRLAWLAESLPNLGGSGIIYCLTVDQAETTARWLRLRGHDVAAYTGSVDPDQRLALEQGLRGNTLKALVATSALGMGFDKGDLAFCVHLGLPPTPVAYYQQIGRAGRSIECAEVIALPRPTEDAAIWRWFESVSLPSEEICRSVLDLLHPVESTSLAALEPGVNLGRSRLGILMSILEVDGAIDRVDRGWIRTDEHWRYDQELVSTLRALRRGEADEMLRWAELPTCRLRFLRESLDDDRATDCGRCDRCTDGRWQIAPDPLTVAAAQELLRGGDIEVEPRRQWPSGLGEPKGRIAAERQPAVGRALAKLGDGGWNPVVERLIERADAGDSVVVPDELTNAIAAILKRWNWEARPTWICPLPSRRRSALITVVAEALGMLGKLPVYTLLESRDAPSSGFQADQSNSAHQVTNVWSSFDVDRAALPEPSILRGPVLLVDDEIDSRWTITVAAWQLTGAGSGPVLPFALRSR
jgi:ATP-dependent DNA helicase RecQ